MPSPEATSSPSCVIAMDSTTSACFTRANGLAHEAAHDALSDVRATIALARLIRARQPKLFDFALALRKKDRVAAELGLPAIQGSAKPFLHVSGMFPAERGCLAVMWPLASHPSNRNELLAWDLSQDPTELATLDAAAIRERLPEWDLSVPSGGLCLWVSLPRPLSTAVTAAADRRGLVLAAGPQFAVDGAMERYLRIPFTSHRPELLREAVDRLALAWEDAVASRPVGRPRSPLVA